MGDFLWGCMTKSGTVLLTIRATDVTQAPLSMIHEMFASDPLFARVVRFSQLMTDLNICKSEHPSPTTFSAWMLSIRCNSSMTLNNTYIRL